MPDPISITGELQKLKAMIQDGVKVRTGCTWGDLGYEPQELEDWAMNCLEGSDWTPDRIVTYLINKYGMEDLQPAYEAQSRDCPHCGRETAELGLCLVCQSEGR